MPHGPPTTLMATLPRTWRALSGTLSWGAFWPQTTSPISIFSIFYKKWKKKFEKKKKHSRAQGYGDRVPCMRDTVPTSQMPMPQSNAHGPSGTRRKLLRTEPPSSHRKNIENIKKGNFHKEKNKTLLDPGGRWWGTMHVLPGAHIANTNLTAGQAPSFSNVGLGGLAKKLLYFTTGSV